MNELRLRSLERHVYPLEGHQGQFLTIFFCLKISPLHTMSEIFPSRKNVVGYLVQ